MLAGGVLFREPPSEPETSPPGVKDSFSVERTRRGPVLPAPGGGARLLADRGRLGGAESPVVRPNEDGPGPAGPGEPVCARDGVLEGGGGVAAAASGLGACEQCQKTPKRQSGFELTLGLTQRFSSLSYTRDICSPRFALTGAGESGSLRVHHRPIHDVAGLSSTPP
jgi:hypothetical protein